MGVVAKIREEMHLPSFRGNPTCPNQLISTSRRLNPVFWKSFPFHLYPHRKIIDCRHQENAWEEWESRRFEVRIKEQLNCVTTVTRRASASLMTSPCHLGKENWPRPQGPRSQDNTQYLPFACQKCRNIFITIQTKRIMCITTRHPRFLLLLLNNNNNSTK